ncbi:MAG: SUMF1/EgtB/PvdO family nonheme iron enzyme [Lentisphaeria bacterium]|nr:SUMF1/EgtB/PvdO family nonheme iron enzyme [Lentisphaeria bacterium]
MTVHIPGYKPDAVELFRCQTTEEFAAFLHFAAGVGFNGKADVIGLDVAGRGALYFENGRIVHAAESTVTGIDAVARMLIWEKTEIHLLRRVAAPRHEFSCTTDNLIMDATLLADQNAALWRATARTLKDVPEPPAYEEAPTDSGAGTFLKRPVPAFWLLAATLFFLLVSSCQLLTSGGCGQHGASEADMFDPRSKAGAPFAVTGLDMVFQPVPAGRFHRVFPLAAGHEKEAVIHVGAFWMADTEVTQADFTTVMGRNPSGFRGDALPVETVTWDDARRYCDILTSMARLLKRVPPDWEYRLPTELEWEYASLAGQAPPVAYSDNDCWHQGNAGKTTRPARSKQPNAWKLYNLPGNVNEWCLDWIGQTAPTTGPGADNNTGTPALKACRGGSWAQPVDNCSPQWRLPVQTINATNMIGFRPVLAPVGQRPSVTWE